MKIKHILLENPGLKKNHPWTLSRLTQETFKYVNGWYYRDSPVIGPQIWFVTTEEHLPKFNPTIHNRFLTVFREYYKYPVMLEFETLEKIKIRNDAAAKRLLCKNNALKLAEIQAAKEAHKEAKKAAKIAERERMRAFVKEANEKIKEAQIDKHNPFNNRRNPATAWQEYSKKKACNCTTKLKEHLTE